jgi:hypothetical protein
VYTAVVTKINETTEAAKAAADAAADAAQQALEAPPADAAAAPLLVADEN